MYYSKRHISNDIKALYPKCINCVNFKNDKKTCVKFVIPTITNYVDNTIHYEYAGNVRNDNIKCGESGKLFEPNYLDLIKQNDKNLTIFIFTSYLSVITNIISNDIIICLIPFSVCFIHGILFYLTYNDIEDKIKYDNQRIKKLSELTEYKDKDKEIKYNKIE